MFTVSRSNWDWECWYLKRVENRRTWRKTLRAGSRTIKNSNVTSGPGIEPRPQWWEARALTIAPSPLLTTLAFSGLEYFIILGLIMVICFHQSSSDDDRIDGKEIDNPKIELLFHETTKNFDKLPIQYRVSM